MAEEGNAIVYALTPWGAELREPIESLIRWSTPLMTQGPGGDRFRAEWLVVALQALFVGKAAAHRSSTVGIAVDGQLFQVRVTRSGTEVSPHDGRDLDAVVRADAAIVLGLAAGVLTLDDTPGSSTSKAMRLPFEPSSTPDAPMSETPGRRRDGRDPGGDHDVSQPCR